MNTQSRKSISEITLDEANDIIIDSIQDIKGKDIVKLDLRDLHEAPADFFIICNGESNTQMRAIAGNVSKRLKYEASWIPANKEGQESDTWILVDYFNTIVHIFHPEAREFYELEELWSDAKVTEYQNL